MKKFTVIATILAGALSLSGGGVFAVTQAARNNALPVSTAQDFAYVDAGILPEEAKDVRTEFDFERGTFVYEIGFTADGIRYEYTVNASSGEILERETEQIAVQHPAPDTTSPTEAAKEPIGTEQAKTAALNKAGVAAGDAVFRRATLKTENGVRIYDVEFSVAGVGEYEYEINAVTGEILEESFEREFVPEQPKPPVTSDVTDSPVVTDTTDVPVTSDVTAPPVSPDTTNTAPGPGTENNTQTSHKTETMLSANDAIAIVLRRAGLTEGQVTFSKTKLERDDGKWVYDLEFYHGAYEYEYEIDAVTGNVLEEDIEPLDD